MLLAYARFELRLLLRNPEQLLLVLVIPVGMLLVFGTTTVLPGTGSLDVLVPGILALAIMSSAMTGLGIATGFQRSSRSLKRLGATPLGTRRLVLGKSLATGSVMVMQVAVLGGVGVGIGWRPDPLGVPVAVVAVALGGAAFAGIGIGVAGVLRAEATLAALNALYLLLLLTGGFILDTAHLPRAVAVIVALSPATALSDALRGSLKGVAVDSLTWLVLIVWAVAAPLLAARVFQWDGD